MPKVPVSKWDARVFIFKEEIAQRAEVFLHWLEAQDGQVFSFDAVKTYLDSKWDEYAAKFAAEVPPDMASITEEGTIDQPAPV